MPDCPDGVLDGRDPDGPGVEPGGVAEGRGFAEVPPGEVDGPDTVGGLDGREAGGVDDGRFDGLDDGLPPTLGVLGPRVPPGVLDRGVPLPELPETVGVLPAREVPGVPVEVGVRLPVLPDTRGWDLPRSLPDCRTLDAFDWSVLRVVCAVSLTFWPVVSAEVAARSAPSRAVLMASSALTIATWPNTPALWDDAPMLSLPPTPSRIWPPRPENRLLIDSTASVSMLVPLPGATPELPEPLGEGVLEPLDPPWVEGPLLPDEPPCLRDMS